MDLVVHIADHSVLSALKVHHCVRAIVRNFMLHQIVPNMYLPEATVASPPRRVHVDRNVIQFFITWAKSILADKREIIFED